MDAFRNYLLPTPADLNKQIHIHVLQKPREYVSGIPGDSVRFRDSSRRGGYYTTVRFGGSLGVVLVASTPRRKQDRIGEEKKDR